MKISSRNIPDVLLLEPQVFGDERGFFFLETYREVELAKHGVDCHFVQDNHSGSVTGGIAWVALSDPPGSGQTGAGSAR